MKNVVLQIAIMIAKLL